MNSACRNPVWPSRRAGIDAGLVIWSGCYTAVTVFRRSRQNPSAPPVDARTSRSAGESLTDPTQVLASLLSRPTVEGVLEQALAYAAGLLGDGVKGYAVLRRGQDKVVAVYGYPRGLAGQALSGPWASMRPRLLTDGTRELYEVNAPELHKVFDEAGMSDVPLSLVVPVSDRGRGIGALVLDRTSSAPVSPTQQEAVTRWAASVGSLVGMIESREDWQHTARQVTASVVEAVESQDFEGLGHAQQVAETSVRIGRSLGLSGRELEELWFAATLHDLGKLHGAAGHAQVGANFLHGAPQLAEARKAIRHHHERWDGEGEPDKLFGEDIPLYARVIAVANAYVHSGSVDAVIEEAGRSLDPRLVEHLTKVIK